LQCWAWEGWLIRIRVERQKTGALCPFTQQIGKCGHWAVGLFPAWASFGGWHPLPAQAIGFNDTGFLLGIGIYFLMLIGAIASSIGEETSKLIRPVLVDIAGQLRILLKTLQYWQPSSIVFSYLPSVASLFYLPLRFFLLLRPPFSKWEYVWFVISFGMMVRKNLVG